MFRVQLPPLLVLRQTSMSTGPELCAEPPGYFESAKSAVPLGSTASPFGYRYTLESEFSVAG